MFCKNCGKEAEANDKFCKSCGSKLDEKVEAAKTVDKIEITENVKKEEVVSSPIVENGNTTNTSTNVNGTNTSVKVEKLKGLKIASLVLGIISLVFFLLNIVLLPLELTGLILAIVYIANNKKFCAGIVLNGIAMILSVAIFSLGTSALISLGNYIDKNPEEFGKKIENFFDDIDKQLDKELENSFSDASKQFEDAKKELQKAKDEIKVYTETNKTTSDKYASGYKYVGSDDYGYIKVPDNWAKFIDVEPNNTIQYSYPLILSSQLIYCSSSPCSSSPSPCPSSSLTTYKYAKNVYDSCKNGGAKNVSLISQKIVNKYYGYKVSCYYEKENVYLTCYIFSDSNNVKHYVSIEGPEKDSEYFDLINTFSLENK